MIETRVDLSNETTLTCGVCNQSVTKIISWKLNGGTFKVCKTCLQWASEQLHKLEEHPGCNSGKGPVKG